MPRRVTTMRLDTALLKAMNTYYRIHGVKPSEQIRRAIQSWLADRGMVIELDYMKVRK